MRTSVLEAVINEKEGGSIPHKKKKKGNGYPEGSDSVCLQSKGWRETLINKEVNKQSKIDIAAEVANRREEKRKQREVAEKIKQEEKKRKEDERKKKQEEKEMKKLRAQEKRKEKQTKKSLESSTNGSIETVSLELQGSKMWKPPFKKN